MFSKRYFLIMLLLIIGISAMSAASAADNVTDTVAVDDADVVSDIDEEQYATVQEDNNENELAVDESSDKLSYYFLDSDDYSVSFGEDAQIITDSDRTIYFYVNPCKDTQYYGVDFYLGVSKSIDPKDIIFEQRVVDGDSARIAQEWYYTFDQKFTPGTYFLLARNYKDGALMDYGLLGVSGNAAIASSDYNAYYNSGAKMTVSVTEKNTGAPINMAQIKCVYTNGKKTVTETKLTDATGKVSFVPNVGPGTWDVTISGNNKHITTNSVKQKITVKKSPVTLKAYKSTTYKGGKVTLKATVQSQGKNVNEGTVTFKINGKTYKVAVKNGKATKKLKLGKVKTYKYTATFKSANFPTKTASSSATVKNKLGTKIIFSDQVAYVASFSTVYIKVVDSNGNKVNGGKLVGSSGSVDVENGVAKFTKYGLPENYFYKSGSNTVKYYRSTITKTYTIKYVPDSAQYKSCTKKIKMTFKYRCAVDRYTGTHHHYSGGYRVHVIVS